MSDAPDPMIGRVLSDRFQITDFIAAGGMGRVYRAIQRPLERDVAIKLMDHSEQPSKRFQRRFFLEASLCARLSHPNVVRIFDYGCDGDSLFFIAMEHLKGETLGQISSQAGPLEPSRAISILMQVCSALIEAHGAGLVHRDLKPSNLFIVTDGLGQEHVKILDFGVVKDMSSGAEFTRAGATLGSPLYMSPEQIEGIHVDARSDLYSLGVILYQLLTGSPPFLGRGPGQVMTKHLTQAPPAFATVNPEITVPDALEAITLRALSKEPDRRFQSARAFAAALAPLEVTRSAGGGAPSPDLTGLAATAVLHDRPRSAAKPTGMEDGALEEIVAPAGADLPVQAPRLLQDANLNTDSVAELRSLVMDGFVAFIDFNCPYCFALHERVSRWGLEDAIQWSMIEHSSHVLDGPFDFNQEQMLSTEVVEVHHRAPDVDLVLPAQRCRSTTATRLQTYVQREFPERQHVFRTAIFRALWQDGLDIGDPDVLGGLLSRHDIPAVFMEFCEEEPQELTTWQEKWETDEFDHSIPVLTHPETGRVLIGLSDERVLKEFLLGERSRVLDSAVCYYQQRPSILLWGWMSRIWQVLGDVRSCCEILQALTANDIREHLSQIAVPDLLIIESSQVAPEEMESIAELARSRSVPWVVATREPTTDEEVRVLSLGALEYLPATDDGQVARARLGRVLRDRYNLERVNQEALSDPLTRLPSRASLLDHLRGEWERGLQIEAPISLVLLDLDAFKSFNKTHGYLSGNRALVRVAEALNRVIRGPGTMVARFSGNEFGVLLPATEEPEAQGTADYLRDAVAQLGIENGSASPGSHLTVTTGTHTLHPSEDVSLFDLIDGASRAIKDSRISAQ